MRVEKRVSLAFFIGIFYFFGLLHPIENRKYPFYLKRKKVSKSSLFELIARPLTTVVRFTITRRVALTSKQQSVVPTLPSCQRLINKFIYC